MFHSRTIHDQIQYADLLSVPTLHPFDLVSLSLDIPVAIRSRSDQTESQCARQTRGHYLRLRSAFRPSPSLSGQFPSLSVLSLLLYVWKSCRDEIPFCSAEFSLKRSLGGYFSALTVHNHPITASALQTHQ